MTTLPTRDYWIEGFRTAGLADEPPSRYNFPTLPAFKLYMKGWAFRKQEDMARAIRPSR